MGKREEIKAAIWWRTSRVDGWWAVEGLTGFDSSEDFVPTSLYDLQVDWPIIREQIETSHVLVIGPIDGKSQRKAFERYQVEGAHFLEQADERQFAIVPLSELSKMASVRKLCFAEWPESANETAIESIADWEVWDVDWRASNQHITFLGASGSRFMYFWDMGSFKLVVEPEPRVARRLLDWRLRSAALRVNPNVALSLTDRQLDALLESHGMLHASERFIRVDAEGVEMTIWREEEGEYPQEARWVFRNGDTEVSEWEPSALPDEFRDPAVRHGCCLPNVVVLAVLVIAAAWLLFF